jgi:hypothetical protein
MLIEHFIQKLRFYLIENTVDVYYKDQLVSAALLRVARKAVINFVIQRAVS